MSDLLIWILTQQLSKSTSKQHTSGIEIVNKFTPFPMPFVYVCLEGMGEKRFPTFFGNVSSDI